jgi:hypothetical protein
VFLIKFIRAGEIGFDHSINDHEKSSNPDAKGFELFFKDNLWETKNPIHRKISLTIKQAYEHTISHL